MCYMSELTDFMQFMKTGRLVVVIVVQDRREEYAKPFFEKSSTLRFSENMRIPDFRKP